MPELYFFLFLLGLLFSLLWQRKRRQRHRIAIIDGSNLLYWKENALSLDPVREAIHLLNASGYSPCVIFDANAGYLVEERYLHGPKFAKRLGLSRRRVHVVPKGRPADPAILELARDTGGIVISRDRFRDWTEAFPAETAPGRIIRGGYRKGRLWLDLDPAAAS